MFLMADAILAGAHAQPILQPALRIYLTIHYNLQLSCVPTVKTVERSNHVICIALWKYQNSKSYGLALQFAIMDVIFWKVWVGDIFIRYEEMGVSILYHQSSVTEI
jgi:hypothetical protein